MPIDTESPEYRGALNCVRSNSILGIVAQRVDELEKQLKEQERVIEFRGDTITMLQRDEIPMRNETAALRSANAELLKALDELIAIADDPDARGDIPEQDEVLDRAKAAAAAARGRES